jgi:uncharacterized SAM-binding protein YcdF (DUF218 family)
MPSLIFAVARCGTLLARMRQRIGLNALVAGALTVAVLPGIAHFLTWPIQTRFDRTDLKRGEPIAGFIALGGGDARVEAAIALGRTHDTQVVVTGHDPHFLSTIHADGSPQERILIEPRATTTFENGLHTAKLLGTRVSERWILVTSASHMPRAMGTFRKAGFNVEPWPVPDRFGNWVVRLHRVTHEWGGLLVYWLEGKTDALFPGPRARASRVLRISPPRAQSTGRRTTLSRKPAAPKQNAQQVAGAAPAHGRPYPAP